MQSRPAKSSNPDSVEASPDPLPSAFRVSPEDTRFHFSHVASPTDFPADPLRIPRS
jgi:hypothetical protein